MSPKDVLLNWINAFHEANAEKSADFYDENTTNHQVVTTPVVGNKLYTINL